MYVDTKVDLLPYLGSSKNLIEFFMVIGYDEKALSELGSDILEKQDNIQLSVISQIKSETANNIISIKFLIDQIYPEKPKITKVSKFSKNPTESNVVFSSCIDNLNGTKKIFSSCYALRFYEIFVIKNNKYHVPKAFLIYSQYPYFTTFYNICSILREFSETQTMPIEMLLSIFVNHIPSPINNNIILVNFEPPITIPKLTGYPYIDFNLGRMFNILPIDDFIKIYILVFLEVDLMFFSPDLEKLNMTMFIFYILNYPLTDSNYFWLIRTIPTNKIDEGDDCMNTTLRGFNANYDHHINLSEFKSLYFILDLEARKKYINCVKKEDKEAKEIYLLLEYLNKILNEKAVRSEFLSENVSSLKVHLQRIKKDYDSKFTKNIPFLFINKDIFEINRKIQEVFYDFILNILVFYYKNYKYDSSISSIKNEKYCSPKLSEEEKIFLKYMGDSIKKSLYFDNFIMEFDALSEIKLSLIFSDEYVNLKGNDINREIAEHIDYFQIMDNYYSLKPGEIRVSYFNLNREYKSIKDKEIIKKLQKNKKGQLFALDENILNNFIFYKKRGYFKSLRENQNEDFIIETNNKISIPLIIMSYFNDILNSKFFLRSCIIYSFCMAFPVLPFYKNIYFLSDIFTQISKLKYFKRYYINVLIKSIDKYFEINQEKGYFTDLNLKNFKYYCELIKDNLINLSILPNEEIVLFYRKLKDSDKDINTNTGNNFVFQYEKTENYLTTIQKDTIIKEKNLIIFNYKGKVRQYNQLPYDMLYQAMSVIYDSYYSSVNFNIERLNYNSIIEKIINIAFLMNQLEESEIACDLINMMISLEKWENDLNTYNSKNTRQRPSKNNNSDGDI